MLYSVPVMDHQISAQENRGSSKVVWVVVVLLLILLVGTTTAASYFYGQLKAINRDDNPQKAEEVVSTPTPIPTATEAPIKGRQIININKEFFIPITDSENEQVGEIKYQLKNYERTDSITVQGKTANAVEGREFLIVSLELTNFYDKKIDIDSKDYVELSVNDADTWVKPDIHNDPTSLEPLGGRVTFVGFPINTEDVNPQIRFSIDGEEVEIFPI